MQVREKVSASKQLGEADARKLIRDAKTVVVAKGKQLDEFPGGKVTDDLVQLLLGSTGNLRAPTIRVGDVLLVGFNEERYEQAFG